MNDAIYNIMYTCIYYHFQHQIHKQAYSMSAIDAIALRKQQPTHCRQQLSSAEIQQLPSAEKPMQREKNSSIPLPAAAAPDNVYKEKYGSA